jgi:dienelactone hydrolase
MSTRTDVEFNDDRGRTLRGWWYLPDAPGAPDTQLPGVVMAHGFSATKEMALDDYAEHLCDGGIAVLVYDHAHLGASDGEPRQMIDPWVQTHGYVTALDWLAARPEVDDRRLGAWGSSFSGGHVLVLGALDSRVRAVVANVPFVGMARQRDGAEERYAAMRAVLTGPIPDHRDDLVGPISPVHAPGLPPDRFVAMPEPEAEEWFTTEGGRPPARWRNEVWSPNPANTPAVWDPAAAIEHLGCATLYVATTEDANAPLVDVLAAFELTPAPKEMMVLPGHHFDPYRGDALVRAATAARDFYRRWL